MKTLFKILMVVFYLVLAEVAVRLFWVQPPENYIVEGNHPTLHHIPKGWALDALANHDFRNRPYKVEKAPGIRRIVFMGDSFTYGFTPANQTIPFHFNKQLMQRYGEVNAEVLNFGFISYSPVIHQALWTQYVEKLKPDLVILLLDTFDFQDDVAYSRTAVKDENGFTLSVSGGDWIRDDLDKIRLVRFARFFVQYLKNGLSPLSKPETYAGRVRFINEENPHPNILNQGLENIRLLAEAVKASGSQFVLFHYPPPLLLQDLSDFEDFANGWTAGTDFKAKNYSIPKHLEAFANKNDIAFFEFEPEVRKMEASLNGRSSTLIYNNSDGHFTPWANSVFAGFILDHTLPVLEKMGVIPDKPEKNAETAKEQTSEAQAAPETEKPSSP